MAIARRRARRRQGTTVPEGLTPCQKKFYLGVTYFAAVVFITEIGLSVHAFIVLKNKDVEMTIALLLPGAIIYTTCIIILNIMKCRLKCVISCCSSCDNQLTPIHEPSYTSSETRIPTVSSIVNRDDSELAATTPNHHYFQPPPPYTEVSFQQPTRVLSYSDDQPPPAYSEIFPNNH